MMKMKQKFAALAFFLSAAVGACAFADSIWLCSISDAVSVDEDGTIEPPNLGGLERPTFFRLDAGKKEVTLLAPESRRGEITKIERIHEGEGFWMFSGMEENRAWNLVITKEGRLTLSVGADGAVWAVFGSAFPEK